MLIHLTIIAGQGTIGHHFIVIDIGFLTAAEDPVINLEKLVICVRCNFHALEDFAIAQEKKLVLIFPDGGQNQTQRIILKLQRALGKRCYTYLPVVG